MGFPPVVIIGGEWIQHVGDKSFHTEESRKGVNHFPSALKDHSIVAEAGGVDGEL